MMTSDENSTSTLIKATLICVALPCLLVAAIVAVSPNFSAQRSGTFESQQPREHPLGGDLLQEFAGGHIWKTDRDKLYDWKHSARVQHDESLLGFAWQESGFFPMVYPPFHYQIASYGVGFGYKKFVIACMFANAIALAIAALAFLLGVRDRRTGSGRFLLLGVLFTPLLLSLNMGQKSAILLTILTVTFVLLRRQKPFCAGLVFGLIAFKPYLAVPLGMAMLLKRQFRFVAGSLLPVSLAVGISFYASPESWTDYISICLGMGDYISNNGYQISQSHSMWASAQMLLGHWAPGLVKPLTFIACIGVLVLLVKIMSGPVDLNSSRFSFQFSACIIATVLVSPHFYSYDLTILLLPLAICGLSTNLPNHINSRWLKRICITVLLGASLCGWVAANLGVQVSTVILLLWLVTIGGGWKLVDLLQQQRTALVPGCRTSE